MPKKTSDEYEEIKTQALEKLRCGESVENISSNRAQESTRYRAIAAAQSEHQKEKMAASIKKHWNMDRVELTLAKDAKIPKTQLQTVEDLAVNVFKHYCYSKDGVVTRTVALGSGQTIQKFVSTLALEDRQLTVTPASLVMRNADGSSVDAVSNVLDFHWRSNKKTSLVISVIPPLERSELGLMVSFRKIKAIIEAFQEAARAQVLVLGIGGLEPKSASFGMFKSIGVTEKKHLTPNDAISEINMSLLNDRGEDVTSKVFCDIAESASANAWKGSHPVFPALGIENIRAIAKDSKKIVIGIAYGQHKAHAIKAVLQAGLLNCLITDYETASHLV